MSEKEKNKENNQKKFDLQDRFSDYVLYAYNHYSVIFRSISHTACGKKDEMLNIFSTLSNSPYLRRESISFCRSQFPSHSIGGRVREGGCNNLKKPFSHRLISLATNTQLRNTWILDIPGSILEIQILLSHYIGTFKIRKNYK